MPHPTKARLGDLIHIIDEASGATLLTIEIDSTRKNSVRLNFDAPDHFRVEREKCEDRVDTGPQHGDPLAEKIKDLLVAAGRRDAKAMDALMRLRIECNEDLADHPTIVVGEDDGKFSVGIVGLLNGLLHSENRVAIVRDDESGNVTGFCVVDATPEGEASA